MDALLGRHAEAGTPAGFAELVAFYRAHPETHPFGMDRLDDAEAMPLMTPAALHALALGNVNAADALIRKVMREADVDALIALDFVDWWAIAGAPSLTVPMGTDDEGRPFGVMLGGRWAEDGTLIGVARRFERPTNSDVG